MTRFARSFAVAVLGAVALNAALAAQLSIPEIPFDSAEPLMFPEAIPLGEAAGVATNSKGDVFVYTRTGNPVLTSAGSRTLSHGGSRLLQFDKSGKFIREIGQGVYGFLFAQQVRVDPQDNVWVVDQMSTQVIKFDPTGRIQMVLSRKPEAMNMPNGAMVSPPDTYALVRPMPPAPPAPPPGAAPAAAPTGPLPGAGPTGEAFNRPTDVAWDASGNIYVTDGYGNARVAKYNKDGKWLKNWGSRGAAPGQFNVLHGIVIDAQGNVYIADRGNRRIQVFDSEGTFKTQYQNVGTPWAVCITPGPKQYIYVSNSNPPDNIDYDGEIIKMELDGHIVGKFGRAGKLLKEFGTVNAIDCRNENELYVGETGNWRVQKVTLRPGSR